jgi:hypothetical protein
MKNKLFGIRDKYPEGICLRESCSILMSLDIAPQLQDSEIPRLS